MFVSQTPAAVDTAYMPYGLWPLWPFLSAVNIRYLYGNNIRHF